MKNIVLLCIFSLLFICCKKEALQQKKAINSMKNSYTITGTIENFNPRKVYLNKIIENSNYIIDSCNIENNSFIFKGVVDQPERFAFSFEEFSSNVIIIIENTDIILKIDAQSMSTPIVEGSHLNNLYTEYKKNSKVLFKKIEYLFPHFQKYRLENDVEKLSKLNDEIKDIEKEFIEYSYNFISKNNDSYISSMILRDQLKIHPIDTLKIIEIFDKLSENVKLSPDSQIIKDELNLH